MPNHRNRRSRRWASRTAIAVLALSLAAGCSLLPREEEALAPPLVRPQQEPFDVVEAKLGTIQTQLRGTAVFTSSRNEPLFFKESGGRIKTVHVKAGEHVTAGQLIVELDVGDLELRTRLQRLNVERAGIQYEQAVRAGLTGGDLRMKEIDLERERLSLDALEQQLERSRLTAPFDGEITYVADLSAGDAVVGYSTLVMLADPSQVRLTYSATSSTDLFSVQAGMEATVTYEDQTYRAEVVQSPSNAPFTTDRTEQDRNSKLVILGLLDPVEGADIGDRADFVIPLETRENVIVIPRSGLRTYLGREYIQVADGERRKELDVEVGLKTSVEVEITRGLEEGAQVILNN